MPKMSSTLLAAFAISLAACTQQTATSESPYRPVATIQDIMDAHIDPAADFIWESVATYSTEKGIEDKQPRTDEEWEKVRLNALTLIEATNLLAMEGRLVAAEGKGLDPGELASETPADIQKAIEANRANFIAFAHALHDAGMQVLSAVEAKDVARLLDAGERLDQACEQCHRTYWYPNAPEPIQTYDAPK
jgi:hypothetical protein